MDIEADEDCQDERESLIPSDQDQPSGSVLDSNNSVTELQEWTVLQRIQFWILRVVEHISVQILSMLLIVTDVILTIIAIASSDEIFDARSRIVSNIFLGYFVVEIILRFIGIGPRTFTRNLWEMVDVVVIGVCVVVAVAVTDSANELGRLSVVGRIFRLFRLVRLVPQFNRCVRSMRLTTSENKRRYRQDGYDLDLTYVTSTVIAMSFPSAGWLKLYRNSIQEVSQFFHDKHKDKFRLYNLCSERDYDYTFFNSNVKRYNIDDHNVPTLEQLLSFVKDVEGFLARDKENVIAVHCKGGKGRTGTMICAWLMYWDRAEYPTGEIAREYFASRRTDTTISKKYQGVQTPSQSRYIDYFQRIISRYNCAIPAAPSLFVKSITILAPPVPIQAVDSDLFIEICDRKNTIISFCVASSSSVCDVTNNNLTGEDSLKIEFKDHVKPCVTGDVKIRFRSKKLPIKYDKVSFYFWFNTTFVTAGLLEIERDMLDNPHFAKYNSVYSEQFGVKIEFDQKQKQMLI